MTANFKGSHALGKPDEAASRARPSWENDTTCAATAAEQAKMRASTARDASVRAEADKRAGSRKQIFVQDS